MVSAFEVPLINDPLVDIELPQRSVADDSFSHIDEFVTSQLILVSPDVLAQYWVVFGHIAYYKRVDVDKLLNY